MSVGYRAVGWIRQKRIYDALVVGGIIGYLALFIALGVTLFPEATLETILLRALGTCALLLLHIVLSIGPLARWTRASCHGSTTAGILASRHSSSDSRTRCSRSSNSMRSVTRIRS